MTMNEQALDLTDEIFEKILDGDERNEVMRKGEVYEIFYIWFKGYWN